MRQPNQMKEQCCDELKLLTLFFFSLSSSSSYNFSAWIFFLFLKNLHVLQDPLTLCDAYLMLLCEVYIHL